MAEVHGDVPANRDNEPAPDRSRYLASPILFPIGEQPPRGTRPRL
jgi:hypothetical protein